MDILAFFRWDMSPEIFSFSFISIRWYGLLYALTFVVGYQILLYIFNKEKVDSKILDSLTIYVILECIIEFQKIRTLFIL